MKDDTLKSLIAGGCSGLAVDTLLFPLDTLKTRLQSTQGFLKSGGFKNIYRGLSSSVIGSIPSASLFYVTYDTLQHKTGHLIGASVAEMVACLVRVPIDNIKQRMQVGKLSLLKQSSEIYKSRGLFGFYRSYGVTIMRDVPFASIQFPLYQYLKKVLDRPGSIINSSNPIGLVFCGMIAGGTSAAITTPIDVLKTNLTLHPNDSFQKILSSIYEKKAYFRGIQPRVLWISIGGSIFLGTHDLVLTLI